MGLLNVANLKLHKAPETIILLDTSAFVYPMYGFTREIDRKRYEEHMELLKDLISTGKVCITPEIAEEIRCIEKCIDFQNRKVPIVNDTLTALEKMENGMQIFDPANLNTNNEGQIYREISDLVEYWNQKPEEQRWREGDKSIIKTTIYQGTYFSGDIRVLTADHHIKEGVNLIYKKRGYLQSLKGEKKNKLEKADIMVIFQKGAGYGPIEFKKVG